MQLSMPSPGSCTGVSSSWVRRNFAQEAWEMTKVNPLAWMVRAWLGARGFALVGAETDVTACRRFGVVA